MKSNFLFEDFFSWTLNIKSGTISQNNNAFGSCKDMGTYLNIILEEQIEALVFSSQMVEIVASFDLLQMIEILLYK